MIDQPPPPSRVEHVPARPAGADAWVDGEWILRRGQWYWLLGRWVKLPPGARYRPWTLVRAADGTAYYAPSTWIDASGATLVSPPPLAFAAASDGAVYDAAGEVDKTGRTLKSVPSRRATENDPRR